MLTTPQSSFKTSLRRGLVLLAFTVSLLGLLVSASSSAQTPNVVATVGMIGNVASEVAGTCANVRALIGPGSDPHLYRASAGDVRTLMNAEVVLYGGLHLEAGLATVLQELKDRAVVVAVSEAAVPVELRIAEEEGQFDPHVWMDVSLWSNAATVIARTLTDSGFMSADCVQQVNDRAATYERLLADLHDWAIQAIGTIPDQQRILVTAHDAFGYFGRAYNIEVEGIQGISTETEAAVSDIRRVAELLVNRGVPALFVESTINPRTINAVLEAVRQRGGSAVIGDELFADALGDSGTKEGTYVGMVLHNVRAITSALGGQVPELPASVLEWETRW